MANTATYRDTPNLAAWNAIAGCAGNVRIVTGTYVGTGTYGKSHLNSLSFDGTLLRISIAKQDDNENLYRCTLDASSPIPSVLYGTIYYSLYCTWTDNKVTWYQTENAERQFNKSGATYRYFALLAV